MMKIIKILETGFSIKLFSLTIVKEISFSHGVPSALYAFIWNVYVPPARFVYTA